MVIAVNFCFVCVCVCVILECQIKQVQRASGLFFCESTALFPSALLCNRAAEWDEVLSLFAYNHIITGRAAADSVTCLHDCH